MSDVIEANQRLRRDLTKRIETLEQANHRLRDANTQLLNLVMTSFGHRSDIYMAARKFMIEQETSEQP